VDRGQGRLACLREALEMLGAALEEPRAA